MCTLCSQLNHTDRFCAVEVINPEPVGFDAIADDYPEVSVGTNGNVADANVNEGGDAPASISTPYSINVGDTFFGSISTAGDQDWIKVTVGAGQAVELKMESGGASPLPNFEYAISLWDSNGNFYSGEDNFDATSSSSVYYNASGVAMDIYVMASDYPFDASSTGTYQLTATAIAPVNPVVYTDQQIADQLKTGYWSSVGLNNGPYAWNVSPGNSIDVNISALTADGQFLATNALAAWTMVLGVNFNIVTTGGDMVFDDNQSGAFATWGTTNGYITEADINVSTQWLVNNGTTLDSYSFQTYIHEIGHALGLGHGGDYNGAAKFGVDHKYINDSWQSTIMSYFSQTENTYVDADFAYIMTPMLADILAVQQLYGVAGNLRTGDTTYGVNSTAGGYYDSLASVSNPIAFTIIDDGGIDLLDYSIVTADQTFNLAGGAISDVGGLKGNMVIFSTTVIENVKSGSGNDTINGNSADNVIEGGAGNDAINGGSNTSVGDTASYAGATGAVFVSLLAQGFAQDTGAAGIDTLSNMENLIGSDYADSLGGDNNHNSIFGGFGNDIINGEGGIDTINGNQGNDTINGGAGNDILDGGEGQGTDTINGGDDDDTINGRNGVDFLYGDDGDDTISGQNKNDVIEGGSGDDTLYGNKGNDTILGGADQDTIYGGASADTVSGDGGNDFVYGGGQADLVYGGSGMDVVDGGSGNDYVSGGSGNDMVYGGNGTDQLFGNKDNDLLVGGEGNDVMSGGDGLDTFQFNVGDLGDDTITDFTEDFDMLEFTGAITAGDINIASAGAGGTSTLITVVGYDMTIWLDGVDSSTITTGDDMMFT